MLPQNASSNSNEEPLPSKEGQNNQDNEPPPPKNADKKAQIYLSLLIVLFSTISVQITMQHFGPFSRAAQCYFNELILDHTSQDIYQSSTVIYWRTGEYYLYPAIMQVYGKLVAAVEGLQADSLFVTNLRNGMSESQKEKAVQMMAKYKEQKYRQPHLKRNYQSRQNQSIYEFYHCSLEQLEDLFNSTVRTKSFYEYLVKIELTLKIPIVYRGENSIMRLKILSECQSSLLMFITIDVDILDTQQDDLKTGPSQGDLENRKRPNSKNLELNITYLQWVILFVFVVVFSLEYRLILKRNREVNYSLKRTIQQQQKLEKLLSQISGTQNGDNLQVNNSSNQSKQSPQEEANQLSVAKIKRIDLPIMQRIAQIGHHMFFELAISFMALVSSYNNHNGLVCFFAWFKISVYLSETDNTLMLGFLFKEALPIYFKLLFNILIVLSGFVFFNMIVYQATRKYETVELAYFQFFFNYFQYGIYENFWALNRYGTGAHILYFLNLLILLYIGNNILQSILANQVMKNSYLQGLTDMIEQIQVNCPACGASPQVKKRIQVEVNKRQKGSHLVSKFLQDYYFEENKGNVTNKNYDIVISSPQLSPYFPKNQLFTKPESPRFYSPKLNAKALKKIEHLKSDQKLNSKKPLSQKQIKQMRQINKIYLPKTQKKLKFQIGQSNINPISEGEQLHKTLRFQLDSLTRLVKDMGEICHPAKSPSSQGNLSRSVILQNRQIGIHGLDIMHSCLQKIELFQSKFK